MSYFMIFVISFIMVLSQVCEYDLGFSPNLSEYGLWLFIYLHALLLLLWNQ